MKIAIAHDYFDKLGGGERLVLNLAKALKADVYTGFIEHKKTFDTKGIRIISLNVRKNLPTLIRNIQISKKFEKYKFPEYDAYIFSGVWCISAAANNKPNILYLHTPPRYMYDLREHFEKQANYIQKIALRKFIAHWKPKDQYYMRQFDVICPNSENVKKRVGKFYGPGLYRKCRVVYTGIETNKFYYKKDEGYFLSTSRLDELKRIDMLIEVFKQMPEKKLVITGTGPEEKKLKKMADGFNNITFAGSVPEERLISLYARCKATIVAARDEDLGLSAIESQAAGKPVIAVREGGLLETVNSKTGIFFEPDVESLKKAIIKCEKKKWNHAPIQKNAKKYDIKVFVRKMRRQVLRLNSKH